MPLTFRMSPIVPQAITFQNRVCHPSGLFLSRADEANEKRSFRLIEVIPDTSAGTPPGTMLSIYPRCFTQLAGVALFGMSIDCFDSSERAPQLRMHSLPQPNPAA